MEQPGLEFKIRVLDGGLALGLTLTSVPRMASLDALAQQLIDELRARKIVYGIDEDAIHNLVWSRRLERETIVARGAPAKRGSNAEIEMLILPPTLLPTKDDMGQVDYRNLENVKQLRSGDVIARKIQADPGEPGYNVFGQRINPPRVRDASYPLGRNVRISEDGLHMMAAMDGHLRWRDGLIDVLDLLSVFGDVDYRKGNIRYQGDVEIYGSVRSGFQVVAGLDLSVYGMVEGGTIMSEDGSVFVSGAAMGTGDHLATIRAKNDVHVGRARFASIESLSGSIIADFAVEHSKIKAAKDLILRGGPALSCEVEVGGQIQVAEVTGAGPDVAAMDQAEEAKRRAHLRVDLIPPLDVGVVRYEPKMDFRGEAVDMSAGGIRVRVPVRMKPAERFQLQFTLPDVPGMMWMEAEVVRMIETPGRRDLHAYAVRYLEVEGSVREAITRFCLNEDLRQNRNLRREASTRVQGAIARRMAPPGLR